MSVHSFVGTTLCNGVYEFILQRLSISAFPFQCTLWYILCFSDWPLSSALNPRMYTQRHTPTVVKGGGLMEPPLEFLICCSILKQFCLQWKKTFDLLYSMRYILWVVALLEVCDVTKKHINNSFSSFYPQTLLLFLKIVENSTQKWLDHLPLMT